MRVAALFSGGKDSSYALLWAIRRAWQVSHLVTVYSENEHSYMYQTAGVELTEYAAAAAGIPQVKVWTTGEKEKEVDDLEDVLARLTEEEFLDGVVSGALKSEYQRDRIEAICRRLGIESHNPVWHRDPEEHLTSLIEEGFGMVMVAVGAEGLDRSWLGRELDAECLEDLRAVRDQYGINMDGEGGEFETVVLDAPHYSSSIVLDRTEVFWERDSGRLLIREAHLEPKGKGPGPTFSGNGE